LLPVKGEKEILEELMITVDKLNKDNIINNKKERVKLFDDF